MENSSEMAVLRSVCEFAFKRAGKDLKEIGKDESKLILEVLEEPISEIIEGLEEPHTELQQKWWEMKLNAVFLLQTLERNGCSSPMFGLPLISYDTYFDMVKAFNWFESFMEVPCLLKTSERFNFYSKLSQHNQQEPVTHLDLHLISSVIGQLLQLAVCDQPIVLEENKIEFHDLLSKLLETILQHYELLEKLNDKDLSEFLNRILLLPVLYLDLNLKFRKCDQNYDFFSNFSVKSNKKFQKMCITKFPCVLWTGCLKYLSKTLQLKQDLDFEDTMNKRFFKVNNFEIETESLCAEYLQIRDTLFKNLPEDLKEDKDILCDLILDVFKKQQAISAKEAKERKDVENSSDSCLRRIENKSPGFEDDIENLFKKADLLELDQEGYLDLFLKNPTVLFKEEYLYRLLDIYHNSSQQLVTEDTISKLRKLMCAVFRNLPLVLQQKFIVYVYTEDINLQLVSESEFNSELTVIFNKFTNNSTNEVLQDVTYLLLIDVKITMKSLVDAVINNPGQIDTVIQILQSLPDLCKCHHTRNHPKKTLLVRSIDYVMKKSRIEKMQEKNLSKFVSAISKDYRYQILKDKECQESSVLNLEEFVWDCVFPNINMESLYTDTFPLSLEFAIKLFTTILDTSRDKPCDWLINLNPILILLVIGDIYSEVVQSLVESEYFDKRMVLRQLFHKLLAAMKNPLRRQNFKIDEKQFDWIVYQIEEYDWRIKIVQHKFITSFIDNGHERHTEYLREIIMCAIKTGCLKLILEVGVVNEEVMHMMLNCLEPLAEVLQECLIIAVMQVLPNLLPTEWIRLYRLVIVHHVKKFSLRLTFIETVIPQHIPDQIKEIMAIQVINDAVIILTSSLPADILQHVLRSYTGLVQFILSQNSIKNPPEESRAIFLADLFGCLSITMTTVVKGHQEILFVSLLDILADVKIFDSVKSAMRENYKSALYRAVGIIKDEHINKTLTSRLDDIFL